MSNLSIIPGGFDPRNHCYAPYIEQKTVEKFGEKGNDCRRNINATPNGGKCNKDSECESNNCVNKKCEKCCVSNQKSNNKVSNNCLCKNNSSCHNNNCVLGICSSLNLDCTDTNREPGCSCDNNNDCRSKNCKGNICIGSTVAFKKAK